MSALHVIWFREDLRVHDHAALHAACRAAVRDGGKVLALYILPGGADQQNPGHPAPSAFLLDSLRDLQRALAERGTELHLRRGAPPEIFSELHRTHKVASVHAHDCRDGRHKDHAVESWSLRAGVPFRILPQFGPVEHRDTGIQVRPEWQRFMMRPRVGAPENAESANIGVGRWPVATRRDAKMRVGGRKQAIKILRSSISDPSDANETGGDIWVWLKPYLDLGALSVREAWQAASSAQQNAKAAGWETRAAAIGQLIETLTQTYCGGECQPDGQWRKRALQTPKRNVRRGQQMSFGFEAHHPAGAFGLPKQ